MLRTGELGKRRCAVERATARVCREAGERVATNVRDLDIAAPNPRDGRRLEIVVDGLPLLLYRCTIHPPSRLFQVFDIMCVGKFFNSHRWL